MTHRRGIRPPESFLVETPGPGVSICLLVGLTQRRRLDLRQENTWTIPSLTAGRCRFIIGCVLDTAYYR
jgi:hypothetical protein